MTIPSKPYATTAQVALLLPNLLNGNTDFDDTKTNPKKTAVTQYLTWISNQIDLQFQQAGYVMPFQVLTDETWPEHQTYYLQLLAALGTAALAGGYALLPAPAINTGRGKSSGNIFQDMFNAELRKIYDLAGSFGKSGISNIRFRAKFYSGTPAEASLVEPTGPNLDYIAGMMNPEDFMLFEDYTSLRNNITNYITSTYDSISPLDWTDFHGLVSNKTDGYSYAGYYKAS